MKRNLYLAALACLALSACKPARVVSLDSEVVAAAQPPTAAKADLPPDPAPALEPGGTFAFSDDSGGKLLAKILPPPEPARLPPNAKAGPKPRKGLAALEQPEPPLPAPSLTLPVVTLAKRPPLRPHSLPDAAPLAYLHDDPLVPQRPDLPQTPLVRQLARDVNEPIPLASLAKPLADRASLDDPTAGFSGERVVAHQPPMRSMPVPFTRVNLPEPFEHRVVAKPPDAEPPVVAPVPAAPK